jgi:pimeloyl-ACP methyl ester carboxylesterase
MAQSPLVTTPTDKHERTSPTTTDVVAEEPTRRVEGSGGISIAVYEDGPTDAPTIVLLHGYPDCHTVWDLVAAELVADHHVVTYDVRGHGASEVPADRTGYRVEHLVADFVAVADAVSPTGPVHLAAHDWGSIQAWPMVTDPDVAGRIASFTSLSGPGLDHVRRWVRAHRRPGGHRWTDAFRQGRRSWYTAMFQTPLASQSWRRGIAPKVFRQIFERMEGAIVDDRWPAPSLAADGLHGLELYRANSRPYRTDRRVVPSAVPVQLLVSRGDPYVTPALLDGIEHFAPTLVRREVEGLHWLPRSKPTEMAGWIREHVEAVEGGRVPSADRTGKVGHP